MSKTALVVVVLLAMCAVGFGPLVIIWSLNTLFGLGIGYTFSTWLASLLLAALLVPSASRSK